jgi:hypothetical protein
MVSASGARRPKVVKPLIKKRTNVKFFLSVDLKGRHIMKLNKEEMKNIFGGVAQVICKWSWAPGYQQNTPDLTSCSGSADGCQAAADAFCWANDACTNVDCA